MRRIINSTDISLASGNVVLTYRVGSA